MSVELGPVSSPIGSIAISSNKDLMKGGKKVKIDSPEKQSPEKKGGKKVNFDSGNPLLQNSNPVSVVNPLTK